MLICAKCGREIKNDDDVYSYNKISSKLCYGCFLDTYKGTPESSRFLSINSFERQCQEADFDNQTFQLS